MAKQPFFTLSTEARTLLKRMAYLHEALCAKTATDAECLEFYHGQKRATKALRSIINKIVDAGLLNVIVIDELCLDTLSPDIESIMLHITGMSLDGDDITLFGFEKHHVHKDERECGDEDEDDIPRSPTTFSPPQN